MRKSTRSFLSNDKLRLSSSNLRALAHPLRLEIMMVIDAHQSASVREIFKELKLEQSLISQHLKILRNAKIVSSSRRGKYVYYSIEYANVQYTTGAIRSFMQNEAKAAISVLEDN